METDYLNLRETSAKRARFEQEAHDYIAMLVAQTRNPDCLEFEPDTVSLKGRLYAKVFPGKPEYADTAAGDEKDRQWLIGLERPVCINGNPQGAEVNWDPVPNIREIQLIIEPDSLRAAIRASAGKIRIVKGTLMHGHTIHHRTHALLSVISISNP